MLIAKRMQTGSGFFDSHIVPLAQDRPASPCVPAARNKRTLGSLGPGALALLTPLPPAPLSARIVPNPSENKDLVLNAVLGFGDFHYPSAAWALA
jgi:hypothetical protein